MNEFLNILNTLSIIFLNASEDGEFRRGRQPLRPLPPEQIPWVVVVSVVGAVILGLVVFFVVKTIREKHSDKVAVRAVNAADAELGISDNDLNECTIADAVSEKQSDEAVQIQADDIKTNNKDDNAEQDTSLKLTLIKCTQCGSTLDIDDRKKTTTCAHCGSKFYNEKSKAKKETNNDG